MAIWEGALYISIHVHREKKSGNVGGIHSAFLYIEKRVAMWEGVHSAFLYTEKIE